MNICKIYIYILILFGVTFTPFIIDNTYASSYYQSTEIANPKALPDPNVEGYAYESDLFNLAHPTGEQGETDYELYGLGSIPLTPMLTYGVEEYLASYGRNNQPDPSGFRRIRVYLDSQSFRELGEFLRYRISVGSEGNFEYYYSSPMNEDDLRQAAILAIDNWNQGFIDQNINIRLVTHGLEAESDIVIRLGGRNYLEQAGYPNWTVGDMHNTVAFTINTMRQRVHENPDTNYAMTDIVFFIPDHSYTDVVMFNGDGYYPITASFSNVNMMQTIFPIGLDPENPRRINASYIISNTMSHELGHALGLGHSPSSANQGEDESDIPLSWSGSRSRVVPSNAGRPYMYDPMIQGVNQRIPALVNYNNIGSLPPIPDEIINFVGRMMQIGTQNLRCQDRAQCRTRCVISRDGKEEKLGWMIEEQEADCEFLDTMCKEIQVNFGDTINKRYPYTNISIYTKGHRGKENKFILANTGGSNLTQHYGGSNSYYFPFGKKYVYLGIGNEEYTIPVSSDRVIDENQSMMVYVSLKDGKEIVHEMAYPFSDIVTARSSGVKEENSIPKEETKHIEHLENVIGGIMNPFGIDLDLRISLNDFNDEGGEVEALTAYMYYMQYEDGVNWQKWRGGAKVAYCTKVLESTITNKYGDCLQTLARYYVPLGTHRILMAVDVTFRHNVWAGDPVTYKTYVYPQDLSVIDGVFGMGIPYSSDLVLDQDKDDFYKKLIKESGNNIPPYHLMPVEIKGRYGLFQASTVDVGGVVNFQKYSKLYQSKDNHIRSFCAIKHFDGSGCWEKILDSN